MLQITEGSAKMLVTAVGADSEWGKTMALVAGEAAETPLQLSLGTLAAAIGKVGLAVGGICFVVLMIRRVEAELQTRALLLLPAQMLKKALTALTQPSNPALSGTCHELRRIRISAMSHAA